MTHHKLKIDAHWFDRLVDGTKAAEVRKHDRDYQIGDRITFRANDYGNGYSLMPTGAREISATISHILPASVFPEGIQAGYSVISLWDFGDYRDGIDPLSETRESR